MANTVMHACNPEDLGSGGKKNKHLIPSFPWYMVSFCWSELHETLTSDKVERKIDA